MTLHIVSKTAYFAMYAKPSPMAATGNATCAMKAHGASATIA
jgi:hypothetical protein